MAEEKEMKPAVGAIMWDDHLLIKAYNNSVKLAKEDLAKRIAKSTNQDATNEINKSTNSEFDSCSIANIILENTSTQNYKVGDYVRATYDDGIDYEAKILYINHEDGMCCLRYIGYENEQEVQLSDLVPSWGKKARRLQFSKAKQAAQLVNETTHNGKKKSKMCYKHIQSCVLPQVPPMPPMPPMLTQNHNMENSEHLSSMLMSWYFSGYYTGIYEGSKMAKAKPKANI